MVGIVVPAYKRRDTLRAALQSLALQTRKDFTVIVVDDHSPEPLLDVVNEFKDTLKIVYKYAEVNGGPGAARQIGLEECYALGVKYVMFLDSDDMYFPHAIERLVHEMELTGCSMISAAIWQEHVEGGGAMIQSDNETWLHGKIFQAAYLKEYEISFPKLRTNEDVVFNLIASQCAPKKGTLNEILYLFRYDNNSITHSADASMTMISTDYITAIYHVALYMMEKLGRITDQVLIDIFATYNHYQTGITLGLITDEIKEQTKYLLHLPQVKEALDSETTLKRFESVPNQYMSYGGKIYFFAQTFWDWLIEFEVM